MKRKLSYLLAVAIPGFLLSAPQNAMAPFSIRIGAPQTILKSGSEVAITVVFTNTSTADVPYERSLGVGAEPHGELFNEVDAAAHQLSRELFAEGVLATGIGFPTVPKGRARVRTIVTATHTKAELDRALEVFRKVGKKLGILGVAQ